MTKIRKPNGGSTLKRLKTTLKDAGLLSRPSAKSKRNETDMRQDRLEKLKKLSERTNPFELKYNRQKHDILGKKARGTIGKPGVSRLKGNENRKKTLLKEFQGKDRETVFHDRRFGEDDATMTVEDKMLERFAREKQSRSQKSALYNIDSEEEELTHFGQSLSKMDDMYEHDPRLDDETSPDQVDGQTVKDLHFGGGDQDGKDTGKRKTYQDVMREVIAKSKFHRQERQKEKEENEEMRRDLNDEFDGIRSMLMQMSESQKPAGRQAKETPEDFDLFVKELGFERKAKPTDRLKTEEELIKEEADRLRKMESDRLKHMHHEDHDAEGEAMNGGDDSDGDVEALLYKDGRLINEENTHLRHKKERKPKRRGAALESSDEEQEELEEVDESEGESDEDEAGEDGESGSEAELEVETGDLEAEGSEDGESGSEAELEVDTGDLEAEGSEDGAVFDFDAEEFPDDVSETEEAAESLDEEAVQVPLVDNPSGVPFCFDAPETYGQFKDLIAGRAIDAQKIVLDRLLTLYHQSLAPQNKEKLRKIFQFVFQHMDNVLSATTLHEENAPISKFMAVYAEVVFKLGFQFTDSLCELVVRKLKKMKKEFRNRIEKGAKLALKPGDVLFFSLCGRMFAATDYHHPIMTPMLTLAANWLSVLANQVLRSRTGETWRSIAIGILICHVCRDLQGTSKKYIPETILFLKAALKPCVTLPADEVVPEGKLKLDQLFADQYEGNQSDIRAVLSQTIASFAELYHAKEIKESKQTEMTGLDQSVTLASIFVSPVSPPGWAWMEVFDGFIDIIGTGNNGFHALLEKLSELRRVIVDFRLEACKKIGTVTARTPLQWQKKQVKELPTLAPNFESNYSLDRKYARHDDENDVKKLRALHKREMKGAVRELRKDASFLTSEKLKKTKQADSEYQKKVKRIYGALGDEQGKANADLRAKKRVKG